MTEVGINVCKICSCHPCDCEPPLQTMPQPCDRCSTFVATVRNKAGELRPAPDEGWFLPEPRHGWTWLCPPCFKIYQDLTIALAQVTAKLSEAAVIQLVGRLMAGPRGLRDHQRIVIRDGVVYLEESDDGVHWISTPTYDDRQCDEVDREFTPDQLRHEIARSPRWAELCQGLIDKGITLVQLAALDPIRVEDFTTAEAMMVESWLKGEVDETPPALSEYLAQFDTGGQDGDPE